MQERELRRRRRAADLDQLAVRRRAAVRQPAAAEIEPAREPVDCAEVDERPAPRRLAEDEHAERLLAENRLRRGAGDAVQLRIVEVRLARHAAPHRLDRAVGRLQLRERALHGAVLHRRAPDGGHRQHRRADGDPERDDERARRVDAQPAQRVAHGCGQRARSAACSRRPGRPASAAVSTGPDPRSLVHR